MRLLVAEDERDLNEIILQKLKSEGYSVDACYDGAEAMDILSYTEYDAVLLDIMMPKSGWISGTGGSARVRKRDSGFVSDGERCH